MRHLRLLTIGPMSDFLRFIHVLGAILAVGPVAVSSSMFPPVARHALADPSDTRSIAAAEVLHRVTRVYAVISIIVPVFGLATGVSLGVLTQPWLLVSMPLTACAAVILTKAIIPEQQRIVRGFDEGDGRAAAANPKRLAMSTGVFNLIWVAVVVLMMYRPG